jgi:GR25 family glycosyltransferase involved in LPS biosynthesis
MQTGVRLIYVLSTLLYLEGVHTEVGSLIPFILYINVHRHNDRDACMTAWLNKSLGPADERWSRIQGVDGEELDHFADHQNLSIVLNSAAPACQMQLTAWSFGTGGSLSTIGCALSHIKVVAIAYAMGLSEVLILEDDISSASLDPAGPEGFADGSYLRALLNSLPDKWTVMQVSFLVFEGQTIIQLHDRVQAGVLWSERNSCTGTDFNLWGTGAYVMSRHGMRQFLSKHAPEFLLTTKEEAEQFCEALDTRSTAISILADILVYDMPGVYYSHIPLFLPDDRSAAQSHIKSAGFNSLVPEQQLLQASQ